MRIPYGPKVNNGSDANPPLYVAPTSENIRFVQGDEFAIGPYKFSDVVTPFRPVDELELPMYHSSEEVEEGVTEVSSIELPSPWNQRYWFAEVRSSYLSTVRYYNGWVPWYGHRPQRVWWSQYSLGASFNVVAGWDPEEEVTVVIPRLSSTESDRLNPGGRYRWSLESAVPDTYNGDGQPLTYVGVRTWMRGDCLVESDWTHTPITKKAP